MVGCAIDTDGLAPYVRREVPPVLWVAPQLETPPHSGGDLRTTRLIAALAARTAVELVVIDESADRASLLDALGLADVHVIGRRSPIRARVVALRRGWPLSAAAVAADGVAAHVQRCVDRGGVVVLDHLWTSIHRPGHGRYVLSLHNAEGALRGSLPAPAGAAWRRWERRLDARRVQRLEQRAVRQDRAELVVVSEEDRRLVGRGRVVPNGADLPPDDPGPPGAAGPLFVGALDYAPNRDAVAWWQSDIAPLLPSRVPPLTVVGRGSLPTSASASRESVRLLGQVPGVQPHLRAATCVAVPLRYGGGTRLKVLEAMAWSRPVVSTSKGVEGLPVTPGVDVLVGDTPQELADHVTALWDQPHLGASLAAAALHVAHNHTWDVIGEDFSRLVLGDPL